MVKGAWLPHPLAVPKALPLCQSSVPTTEAGCVQQPGSQAGAAPRVRG